MSAQNDNPFVYAASVNPPRRAKRQRTGSLVGGGGEAPLLPAPVAPQQPRKNATRPPILPKQPVAARDMAPPASPESDSNSDGEDDYDPARDAAPPPKRRGRKPGTMSRSARESLRKLNHSRIEKARRTKINETLATLSSLVGDRDRILHADPVAPVCETREEESAKKGKAKPEEKEFKLDVLVKTVEYMQELVTRVQALETQMCNQCRIGSPTQDHIDIDVDVDVDVSVDVPPSPKRKRPEELEHIQHAARRSRQAHDEDDSYIGDDEDGLAAADEEQPSPMPFTNTPVSASPCLPPIASWLPHPYVDPSSFMTSSPKTLPVRSPQNAQLPSPPPSGRFRPAITLANMPALTLPGPAHPLVTSTHSPRIGNRASTSGPVRQPRKSVSASPTVSPTWTPEDETAASLLLQMSVKPRSNSSASSTSTSGILAPASSSSVLPKSMLPLTPRSEDGPKDRVYHRAVDFVTSEIVTPGSLLGMRD